ncbi:RraA family protein [Fusibacter paucivorans]|uniref:Putative 4-hydroxy-4-methyl-2-oxoglutarate aldolase n=1 Tax=Fusibacter paucivorans TaxID=76009 RepID=A0ABS5PN54_9FIRM|nr:RraA family protein [Fusibacter paucivorans]MBS7526332.1 RraA family protein [Fusibacter paucivorans]
MMTWSEAIAARAMKVDPALIGHYIEDGFMNLNIKPVADHFKLIGPAFPVTFSGRNSAMLFYALRRAPEGSVIVVDRCGDNQFACVGEGVTRIASQLKLGGIVIDGPSTDTIGIRNFDFPIFSTGISPVTTTGRFGEVNGDYNVPITCGGVTINPGDIIFGDLDGIIVIPPERFLTLLEQAEAATAREKEMFGKMSETDFRNKPFDSEVKVEAYFEARQQQKNSAK